MKLYLAGGAVRDLLLGNPITDRDYLVMDASREDFLKAFPSANEVGQAFPIFLVDKMEFSFPRAATLTDELNSRDLTVNALLLDEEGSLVCHPKALEDLHARTLRPTSRQAFADDPLRVFRAARFWAKLPDFTPHHELIETMRSISNDGLLKTISADRISQETMKALGAPQPGNYLRLLAKSDCLAPWFTEFKESLNIPAGPLPYHDESVLEHTARTMDCLAGDSMSVWMGLCHDIGKTQTAAEKYPKHHGHDRVGASLAEGLAKRIRLSNAFATAGAKASKWHMTAARYRDLRPGTKVDLLMELHLSRTFEPLFALVKADHDMDFRNAARRDLTRILNTTLPPEARNLGAESGRRLRELRAQILAAPIK